MKTLIVCALCMFLPMCIKAQSSKNDTLIINKPQKVTIVSGENTHEIKIEGSEGNPNFSFSKRIDVDDDTYSVTHEKSDEWNFDIPFSKQKAKRYSSKESFFGGIYWGFVNSVDGPKNMNINMSSSYEIGGNIINFGVRPWKDANRFSFGFGLRWRNYRMNGHNCFTKDDKYNIVIAPYPKGSDIDFSRLKIFSLTVPFMYSLDFGKDFTFSLGPVLCINTYGSMKTHYTDAEGNKIKLLDKKINQQKVSVDLEANISFHSIGVYARYSPCNVLNTDFGPEFQTFTTGICIFM